MGIEVHPASQLAAHAAHVRNPFDKAMFKLRLGRYRHDDATQCIDRNQETGNHYLQIRIFQQILGQISIERIDNAHLIVQTDDNVRSLIFLGSMQDYPS